MCIRDRVLAAQHERLVTLATAADRCEQGHSVVVAVGGVQQLGGQAPGQVQDLSCVAVVDPQDRRAALGLDADTLEAEAASSGALVDVLRVVVEDEQACLLYTSRCV